MLLEALGQEHGVVNRTEDGVVFGHGLCLKLPCRHELA
jgi:hypothetical protein